MIFRFLSFSPDVVLFVHLFVFCKGVTIPSGDQLGILRGADCVKDIHMQSWSISYFSLAPDLLIIMSP